MSKTTEKIKEEFFNLLPPTIFFFIALHIIAIIRSLILESEGLQVTTTVSVTITALVLGKCVVIADLLPFINRYPHKPLIHNIAWKTIIYVLISIVIHYLEHLIDFWKEAGRFVAANHKLLEEIVWPHFWAVQILLVILVLTYCTMRELTRIIGKKKMIEIFFGTKN
jgi:hypothetical protein